MTPKVKNIIAWIISGFLILAFLASGGFKLMGNEGLAATFDRFGLPGWVMYVVGTLEVLGAIGLIVKPTRFWAALGLTALMVGAVAFHLLNGDGGDTVPSAVLLVLAGITAFLRKKSPRPIGG